MFTLPTILSSAVAIVVFYFMAKYINRAVAEKGIPSGIIRGLLVIFLASVVALIAGAAVDWIAEPHSVEIKESK
jgi:uncharacterized membrane-anchored protein